MRIVVDGGDGEVSLERGGAGHARRVDVHVRAKACARARVDRIARARAPDGNVHRGETGRNTTRPLAGDRRRRGRLVILIQASRRARECNPVRARGPGGDMTKNLSSLLMPPDTGRAVRRRLDRSAPPGLKDAAGERSTTRRTWGRFSDVALLECSVRITRARSFDLDLVNWASTRAGEARVASGVLDRAVEATLF